MNKNVLSKQTNEILDDWNIGKKVQNLSHGWPYKLDCIASSAPLHQNMGQVPPPSPRHINRGSCMMLSMMTLKELDICDDDADDEMEGHIIQLQ